MESKKTQESEMEIYLTGIPSPNQLIPEAPEGYYEKLPDMISFRTSRNKSVFRIGTPQKVLRLIAAAAIIGGIWLGVSNLVLQPSVDLPALTYFDLVQYADNQIIDEEFSSVLLDLDNDITIQHMQDWIMNYNYSSDFNGNIPESYSEDEIIDYLMENELELTLFNL